MYAENLIVCTDERERLTKLIVAVVLALNSYSFRVHEVFSNALKELEEVKELINHYGGHFQPHPKMEAFLSASPEEDQETRNSTDIRTMKMKTIL